MISLPPEYVNAMVAIGSGLVSSVGTYLAVRRKQKSDDKVAERKSTKDEMQLLIEANTEFRLEIKKDLAVAKAEIAESEKRIHMLEDKINEKDRIITKLSTTVAYLGAELRRITGKDYDLPL